MFIRQVKKKNTKNGKTFIQYQLCQAARINGKVKQQSILYLGSSEMLSNQENRKYLVQVLQALIFKQSTLFSDELPTAITELAKAYYEKFLIKYEGVALEGSMSIPPVAQKAKMESVDIDSLEVQDVKGFGAEHLCLQTMERLELGLCLEGKGFTDKQVRLAQLSIISRAIFSASEHKTAQLLKQSSELPSMLGFQQDVSHYSLYNTNLIS